MGTATGLFKNSGESYSITIVGDSITNGTFDIEGDVVKQTGAQTRKVADIFTPIRPTQLRFTVREGGTLYNDLADTKIASAVVTLRNLTNSLDEFVGYVQPQNIERNQYWAQGQYVLTCIDGLTTLELKPYTMQGFTTLASFIEQILEPIGTANQALYIADWQDTAMATSSPALIRFDAGLIDAQTEYEALQLVLKRFGLILSQTGKRGAVEWILTQRKLIGQSANGWLINFANSSVTSVTQSDSNTLTDADIIAEHIKGKTDSVERIDTFFKWNIADPFIINSSFKQLENGGLNGWDKISGTLQAPTLGQGNVTSTDNAQIFQRANYIKPANAPFQLDFTLGGRTSVSTDTLYEFNYAKVTFIDPISGDKTYLNNDGSVSATQTVLSYENAPKTNSNNIIERSIILEGGNSTFGNDRIVDIELYFFRLDTDLVSRYDNIFWVSIKSNLEESEIPSELLTQIDSTDLGSVITSEFPISEQTQYNSKGAIEVLSGGNWVVAADWGTDESIDTVYTRDINRQSQTPLIYYKLQTTPSYFANREFTNSYTYDSRFYIPVYQLVNYTARSIDLQIIERRADSPEAVTRQFIIDSDTAGFAKIPVDPLQNVTVSDMSGDIGITYPKPIATNPPNILVTWSDIQVRLSNNELKEPANGSATLPFKDTSPFLETTTFFYDIANNIIDYRFRTIWLFSPAFRDTTKYAKLFDLVSNGEIVGNPIEQSAPIALPQIEPIAKALFKDQEAEQEAVLTEAIWNYQTDSIAILGEDIDADVTSLVVDPSYPVRVTLAQGDRITLHSGTKNFDLVVSAKTIAGSLTIPVQNRYLLAYKGAKIKYSQASTGSQLLIQPDKVLIVAQNADGNASSALNLIAGQGVAIAELSAEVLGANGLGNSAGIKFEVNQIGARAVLKVDGGGNIASINLLSGEENSSVKINADQIDVNGEATFFAGITEAIRLGQIQVPTGNVAIRATRANEPETREDGSPLQANDLWFVTDEGNLPNIWNGSEWVRAYTVINGGDITTGTVAAQFIDVTGLFALNITITGSLRAIDPTDSGNYVQISSAGLVGFQGGTKRFEVPVVGTPMFTGNINNTVVDLQTSELRTNPAVQTDGGVIVDNAGIRAYNTAGNLTVNISNTGAASFSGTVIANSGSLGNLTIAGTLGIGTAGKIIFGSTLEVSKDKIKYANVELNNLGVVAGDARFFSGGLLIQNETQFNYGVANLTKGSNLAKIENLNGKLDFLSTNGTSVNGTNTFSGTVTNPTSITVLNGYVTAIS